MCRMASFLYKNSEVNWVEIAVYNLMSHSGTQKQLNLTERMGWYEGHYLPDGKIECRTPDGVDKQAQAEIKRRYPTFTSFLKWCFTQKINGNLELSYCDLKGIKFPKTIKGNFELGYCNLKGVTLPETINGNLDLSFCDLKGIKLPETINGNLNLRSCKNLKGIKLPETISGELYIYGCHNIDKEAIMKIKIVGKIYR